MVDYINRQFEVYVLHVDIEESFLLHHPVPFNIQGVKVVGDCLRFILSQNSLVMSQDSSMDKFQQKVCNVMGFVSRLWKWLKDVKRTGPEETVSVPIEEYIKLVEQSVLLLGQASNTVTYGRRLNVSKPLMKDPKNAKPILKEKASLLQKIDDKLFSEKFRSHVEDTGERKKQTLKAFTPTSKKPF